MRALEVIADHITDRLGPMHSSAVDARLTLIQMMVYNDIQEILREIKLQNMLQACDRKLGVLDH